MKQCNRYFQKNNKQFQIALLCLQILAVRSIKPAAAERKA